MKDDELGFNIRERVQREVQNAFGPLFNEIITALREQARKEITHERIVERTERIETVQRPLGTVRVERPTIARFSKMEIPDENKWHEMVRFGPNIDTWAIHNLDTTDLWYAYNDNADNYNTLGADDVAAKDTRPESIWVRRASSGNTVKVIIEWWEYATDA